ncbi:MAG: DUF1015 family protein [Bacteroidota bacterium]|nr:DUF1015 family protein [Bacteroidota bacterium]
MTVLKAFKGIRPKMELAAKIASRPYDVLNSEEAKIEAGDNQYSFYHVIKPEIDLADDIDHYSKLVYQKGNENLQKMIKNGWLVQDESECLYIYAQTMNGKTQYGIVGCAGVEDYMSGKIKKHELTRKDKEEDRMNHVRVTNANSEPVFFTYPAVKEIYVIVENIVKNQKPEYDFVSEDGFGHHFWTIKDKNTIERLINLFAKIPATYVADGHHRTAAAALVGNERKQNNTKHTGKEEYNYFLAVHFPDNQLTIIDYNRVVKDLNGLSKDDFLKKIKVHFDVLEESSSIIKPNKLHNFSMYLEGKWYSMKAKSDTYDNNDPIGVLDVTILSKYVLDEILGIKDLRTDKRIDFVGGIRGLGELEKRVNSGEMKVAFALYAVTMDQLINIADTGNIMPPKTTWFEPKLRSGLVVHSLE